MPERMAPLDLVLSFITRGAGIFLWHAASVFLSVGILCNFDKALTCGAVGNQEDAFARCNLQECNLIWRDPTCG
jgi:hypothetical protein